MTTTMTNDGLMGAAEDAAVGQLVDAGLLDELMSRVDAGELQLTGEGGFLPGLVKAVLERGLAAELTGHLGYDKGDPAGRGSPNSRNGFTPKTISTEVGDVALDTPRDRALMVARSCSHLGWEAAAGMPTFRPDERDLTSVEPDRHRSLIGRRTLGEPTRRRQALHEPTRPTTYRTLRTSARVDRRLTYKSALQPAQVGPDQESTPKRAMYSSASASSAAASMRRTPSRSLESLRSERKPQ